MSKEIRLAGALALGGAILGVVFAALSTSDYTAHLDRQMHAVHCSFIPGADASGDEANPCKTALFSPYSALFRQTFWGGIPISLGALGCFCFFAGLGIYLLLAPERAPRRTLELLAVAGLVPLAASVVMFGISLTQLHTFCKICIGIYFSSALVFAASVITFRALGKETKQKVMRPKGTLPMLAGGVVALGVASLLPAVVYASSLPDYKPYLTKCGTLATTTEPHNALVKIPTTSPKRQVILFEDPLCPTCREFHGRLLSEGIFEKLDVTLALFPLDNECNWMLDRAVHPGACVLARAVLCGKDRARAVLEWAYDN
ncbi:MAG TPA: vitamin K epoxide reductase family protein, partial [Polyangiaceae bacterium]|nr:vitamin K epoxide reductase family protein [Polyangiaceae bacterium]